MHSRTAKSLLFAALLLASLGYTWYSLHNRAKPEDTIAALVQAVHDHKIDPARPFLAYQDLDGEDTLKNEVETQWRIYTPHVDGLVALDSGKAQVEYRPNGEMMQAILHYTGDHGGFPTYDVVSMVRSGNRYMVLNIDGTEYGRRFQRFNECIEESEQALKDAGQPDVSLFFAQYPQILNIATQYNLPCKTDLLAWK